MARSNPSEGGKMKYEIISPPSFTSLSLEELFAFLDRKGERTTQLDLLMWFDQNKNLQWLGEAPERITALITTARGYPVWVYDLKLDMAGIQFLKKENDLLKERHFLIKTPEST
jgi:hypothetical protein